jgi:membrane protease YdiL (CAAX protease family)
MALRFAVLTAATMLATLYIAPERFFAFPTERTRLWLLVMLLYPVLSALPQEIIYRAFFFRRYATLVPSVPVLGALSAIAFGLSHLMMNNWIAPVFCILGGLIFAHTYTRTQSLKWAAIEHAAYGCMIFTVGFGYFFYIGNWR